MLFAPTEPTGTNAIKNTQIKAARQIPRKQTRLFLPNHGFFRPKNHTVNTERPTPVQNA